MLNLSFFVLFSDPNIGAPVKVKWPEYDPENREYLSVQEPCSQGRDFGEENYAFWRDVVEPMRVVPTQKQSN